MNNILQRSVYERYNILRKILQFKKNKLIENNYKIGFIHITKTGGTDIKDKNTNNEIYFGRYHYEDTRFYKNFIPCFAIIREPIERFKSLFFYNMYGSSKYGQKKFYKMYEDINDFINDLINNPNFVKRIENGWQFRPQYNWLTDNKENTFIIKYNRHNNCNNVIYFLKKEFDIDYRYDSRHCKINMTYYNHTVISDINKENYEFLYKYYENDFYIYEKLSETNQPYARLSSILN